MRIISLATITALKSILILSAFICCSTAFAYISGKDPINEKLIYCPDQVVCTEQGNFASCKNTGENIQYWGTYLLNGGPQAATYKFWKADSSYHAGNTSRATTCSYKLEHNPSPTLAMTLQAKSESNIEAYEGKTTDWKSTNNILDTCQSSTPSACPLKERSGLGLIVISIDPNYSIRVLAPYASIGGIDGPGNTFIAYENAAHCWGLKKCTLNIDLNSIDSGYIAIGSIIVDMDNKMKIIEVTPIKSSGMEITLKEPFNTIEIKKSNPPTFPSVEISNFLKQEVRILSGNTLIRKISTNEKGTLFSYRAKEVCQNQKECSINLTDFTQNGLIGTITVDVENNMDILSIQSTRPSEIIINKVGDHKIEVNYSTD